MIKIWNQNFSLWSYNHDYCFGYNQGKIIEYRFQARELGVGNSAIVLYCFSFVRTIQLVYVHR